MSDLAKGAGDLIAANVPLSIAIGVFIFCIFFEVSKIKVYPLRWLWKLISWPFRKIDEQRTQSFKNIVITFQHDIDNKLTQLATDSNANCTAVKAEFVELGKRFDKLDLRQAETEERLDMLAAARIKNHVLNFARQCRKGEPHSHEDFANLFKENVEYQTLVKKYRWDNDVYKHDFAYIQKVYDKCNDDGGFLE